MANRMKSICKKVGCNNLLDEPGYCIVHKKSVDDRSNWQKLDAQKTPEQKKFYNSNRWRKTSKRHKINNPLCEPCKLRNKRTAVTITHHEPDLNYLLENGMDPYNDEYLVSICDDCHMVELRNKKGKHKINKNSGIDLTRVLEKIR